MEVDVNLIRPSPYQPRLAFGIDDLKREIERDGLLSDLVVRKRNGLYEIIDGERRWRVLKELGWKKVPVQIRDVDDRTARLTVYKLNTVRANYTTEERAKYFKKLADGGMTFYQIGKELSLDDNWVLAHINVFKFPEDIQKSVWSGDLTVGHVQTLEPLIGANIDDATRVAREVMLRKLSIMETRKLARAKVPAIQEARVKAAEEAVGVITPKIGIPKTPDELEKAARSLLEEARRKREEAMTPEEKAAVEAERKRREEERRRAEQERRKREEEEKRRIEEEARKRAKQIVEAEKRRIEEEAREKEREHLRRIATERRVPIERYLGIKEEVPTRKVEREMAVKKGVIYTIGELDCERCGKHYVIKCDGRTNWLE